MLFLNLCCFFGLPSILSVSVACHSVLMLSSLNPVLRLLLESQLQNCRDQSHLPPTDASGIAHFINFHKWKPNLQDLNFR